MRRPSIWLFAIVFIHGTIGNFGDILETMMTRLEVPLVEFYNSSLSREFNLFLSPQEGQTIHMAMINLSVFGSVLAVFSALPKIDTWGRKVAAVYLKFGTGIVAAGFMVAAWALNNIECFAIAQLSIGILKSLRLGATKVYISECAPDDVRGFATQALSTQGSALSLAESILMLPTVFGNYIEWHWIPIIVLGQAVVFVLLACWFPESPKFLALRDQDPDVVQKAIKTFHGKKVDIDALLLDYKREFSVQHTSLRELFADQGLWNTFWLIAASVLAYNAGANAVFLVNDIPLMLRYGWDNDYAVVSVGVLNYATFPVVIMTPYLYERIGRRPVMLIATGCGIAGLGALVCAQIAFFITSGSSHVTMVLIQTFNVLVLVSNGLGMGTAYLIIIADLIPAGAKLAATQAAVLFSSVVAIFFNFYYIELDPILGVFIYLPIMVLQIWCFVHCWKYLPETRALSVAANFVQVLENHWDHEPLVSAHDSRKSSRDYGTYSIPRNIPVSVTQGVQTSDIE